MTRSMYLSWARSDEISDRVETVWTKVDGIEVGERALAIREESRVVE